MPLVKCHVGYIYFSHIPKTGGTSIEDYLAERFGSISLLDRRWLGHWFNEQAYKYSSLKTSPQHLTAPDALRILPETPAWIFAFVRDPLERIVSEFNYQKNLFSIQNFFPIQFRCLSQMSFSLWLNTLLRAARFDFTLFDNHFRPQVDFVTPTTEVFFFEQGLDKLIPRLNEITESDYPSIGISWKNKGKSETHFSLTKDDTRIIKRFYSDDYERFQYPFPSVPADVNLTYSIKNRILSTLLAPFVVKLWRGNAGKKSKSTCRLADKARRVMLFRR